MTPARDAVAEAAYARWLEALWPVGHSNAYVYAVLDGARDERIAWRIEEYGDRKACLYEGNIPQVLENAAPHLLHLFRDDHFCRRLFDEGWGQSWGVFMIADTSLASLRRHFRQFMVVRGPTGARLVFRWYDPRVLRAYLPTCTIDELRTVFGPISAFVVEGREPTTAHKFSFDGTRMTETLLQLRESVAASPH